MNNVVLIGRLTRDPELRYTPDSKAVCTMNIAVNRPFDKDKADFFRVIVFGKRAENCAKYLSNGSMVGINGRIQNNNWEDNGGTKHYGNDIVADNVEFLSSNNTQKGNSSDLPNGFEDATNQDEDDDEIPF